jgi:hypothetical protein
VGPGVTEFVFEYYIQFLEGGRPPGLDVGRARDLVKLTWDEAQQWLPESSPVLARVTALRERVEELLR